MWKPKIFIRRNITVVYSSIQQNHKHVNSKEHSCVCGVPGGGGPHTQYFVHITRYVFSCQTSREVSPIMAYPTLDRGNLYVSTCVLHCLGEVPCGHRVGDHTLSSTRLRRIPLWDLEKAHMGVGTKLQIVDGWQTSFGLEEPGENVSGYSHNPCSLNRERDAA